MTRTARRTVFALAAAALLGGFALPGAAIAQTEIRISTAAPDVSPLSDAFRQIKAQMEAKFPNQIKVSVHTASVLFRQGTELPAMQRGNLEMASLSRSRSRRSCGVRRLQRGLSVSGCRSPDQDVPVRTSAPNSPRTSPTRWASSFSTRPIWEPHRQPADRQAGERAERPQWREDAHAAGACVPDARQGDRRDRRLDADHRSVSRPQDRCDRCAGQPTNMTRDWKFNEVTQQVVLTRHLVSPSSSPSPSVLREADARAAGGTPCRVADRCRRPDRQDLGRREGRRGRLQGPPASRSSSRISPRSRPPCWSNTSRPD